MWFARTMVVAIALARMTALVMVHLKMMARTMLAIHVMAETTTVIKILVCTTWFVHTGILIVAMAIVSVNVVSSGDIPVADILSDRMRVGNYC